MSTYGIVIMSQSGLTILDEKSMIQSWGNTIIDNIDENNPVLLRFRYPQNTEDVLELILSITYDLYRTYSDVMEETGLTTSSSAHSHAFTTRTGNGTGSMSYEDFEGRTETVEGHTHHWVTSREDGEFQKNHTHSISTTTSAISESSHGHSINDHSHGLEFTTVTMGLGSLTVDIYVNNDLFMSGVAPEGSVGLEIPKSKLNYPGWNDIEIYSSEGLSRVNANYFTQIYLGT